MPTVAELRVALKPDLDALRAGLLRTKRELAGVSAEAKVTERELTAASRRWANEQAKALNQVGRDASKTFRQQQASVTAAEREWMQFARTMERESAKAYGAVRREMQKTEAEAKRLAGQQAQARRQAAGAVGAGIGAAGTAALGAGVAGAAGLGAAASQFMQFDQALRNVNSLLRVSEAEFARLQSQVRTLAQDPQILAGPADLAKGLYDIVSSGFSGAQALDILKVSATGATAGMTDTATASKVLTAVLNSQIAGVNSAQEAMDVLFQEVNLGVNTFEGLAGALGTVLPTAKLAGATLQEVAAALAALTRQGLSVDEAGTALSQLFAHLINPGKQGRETLKELGIAFGIAGVQGRGFSNILKDMASLTQAQKQRLVEALPEMRTQRAMLGLLTEHGKLYTDMLAGMGEATEGQGAAQKALTEQLKGAQAQWDGMIKDLRIVATDLGKNLMPVVKELTGELSNLAKQFGALSPEQQQFMAKAAIYATGFALITGAVIKTVEAVARLAGWMKALGLLTGGAGGLAAAGGALAVPAAGLAAGAVAIGAGQETMATGEWLRRLQTEGDAFMVPEALRRAHAQAQAERDKRAIEAAAKRMGIPVGGARPAVGGGGGPRPTPGMSAEEAKRISTWQKQYLKELAANMREAVRIRKEADRETARLARQQESYASAVAEARGELADLNAEEGSHAQLLARLQRQFKDLTPAQHEYLAGIHDQIEARKEAKRVEREAAEELKRTTEQAARDAGEAMASMGRKNAEAIGGMVTELAKAAGEFNALRGADMSGILSAEHLGLGAGTIATLERANLLLTGIRNAASLMSRTLEGPRQRALEAIGGFAGTGGLAGEEARRVNEAVAWLRRNQGPRTFATPETFAALQFETLKSMPQELRAALERAVGDLRPFFGQIPKDAKTVFEQWGTQLGDAAQAFEKAATETFSEFKGGLTHSLEFLNDIIAQFGQYLSRAAQGALGVPGRAMGGPVSAGSPYLVGERGPELFIPNRSGTIAPGGGGNVQVVFNVSTPDAASFRRSQGQIAMDLSRALEFARARGG